MSANSTLPRLGSYPCRRDHEGTEGRRVRYLCLFSLSPLRIRIPGQEAVPRATSTRSRAVERKGGTHVKIAGVEKTARCEKVAERKRGLERNSL